jgi:hypothetical protein
VRTHRLEREQILARPLEEVFSFFAEASNLALLTPPSMHFRLITAQPVQMRDGTLIEYRLRVRGVPIRWVSRIEDWAENRGFADRQLKGPYRHWFHRHEFEATGEGTRIIDRVEYALPLGVLGLLALPLVRRDLDAIFAYRREAVARLLT